MKLQLIIPKLRFTILFLVFFTYDNQLFGQNTYIGDYILKNQNSVSENSLDIYTIAKKDLQKLKIEYKIIRKLPDNQLVIKVNNKIPQPHLQGVLRRTNNLWKFSNKKNWDIVFRSNELLKFVIQFDDPDEFQKFIASKDVSNKVIKTYAPTQIIEVLASGKWIEKISHSSHITFIDLANDPPVLESSISYLDLGANRINLAHHNFADLDGSSITVSIKELRMDTADVDLSSRFIPTGLASPELSQHATTITTMIGGAGNSSYKGKGVAPFCKIASSDFSNIFPDQSDVLQQHNIWLQNHSYGQPIDNQYGAETQAYDQAIHAHHQMVHVFSAGNLGQDTSESGPYAGIPNFANLSGNLKMNKNGLVIGAANLAGELDNRSSRGPTFDGRIKPDLVAYGQEGSSDAAAITTGVIALLQEQHKILFDELPTADLIKSLLIAGADHYDQVISFGHGYGRLNAYNSLQILNNSQFVEGSIPSSEEQTYDLEIPLNVDKVRVVLNWIDPPANPGDAIALVNDLNLSLTKNSTNEEYLPWVISSDPQELDLDNLPIRSIDRINNAELITIDNPEAGSYVISVSSEELTGDAQTYAIAYHFESTPTFEWTSPTTSDIMDTEEFINLFWNTSLTGSGKIEILEKDGSWTTIGANIDVSQGYYSWQTDQAYYQSHFRFSINGDEYLTYPINIHQGFKVGVGFNCEDSFKLAWPKQALAEAYQVKRLNQGRMTPIMVVTDTSVVIDKSDPSLHYAVSPIFGFADNYSSKSLAYDQQGINCFYRTFTSELVDKSYVSNRIFLTSIEDIDQVEFFRLDSHDEILLANELVGEDTELMEVDLSPVEGYSLYYAVINLHSQEKVYTDSAAIYYADTNTLISWPNPIQQNQELNILSEGNGNYFQLLNEYGQVMDERRLYFATESIDIGYLHKGIYIMRVYNDNGEVSSAKLIVTAN